VAFPPPANAVNAANACDRNEPLKRNGFPAACLAACALVAVLDGGACAIAQDYPTKPVRILAPSTPGGGFDLVVRVLGNKLSEQMGQQFVVENRSGGATLRGSQNPHAEANPEKNKVEPGCAQSVRSNAAGCGRRGLTAPARERMGNAQRASLPIAPSPSTAFALMLPPWR
jgi:hypothetical protein